VVFRNPGKGVPQGQPRDGLWRWSNGRWLFGVGLCHDAEAGRGGGLAVHRDRGRHRRSGRQRRRAVVAIPRVLILAERATVAARWRRAGATTVGTRNRPQRSVGQESGGRAGQQWPEDHQAALQLGEGAAVHPE
jgi:hypothetical protein